MGYKIYEVLKRHLTELYFHENEAAKIKIIFSKTFHVRYLYIVPKITTDFTSKVNQSNVPFEYKFPMVMHFVLCPHKCCESENIFYVFNYD